MSITTKTGDDGKSRWQGKTVDKDGPLLEAVGELDELQAVVGLIQMPHVEKDLYGIMGELAYDKKYELKRSIEGVEKEIEILEKELPKSNQFLIFEKENAAYLNWVRTVVRRVERRLVTLNKVQQIDPNILIYINRLSDYIYLLARRAEES